MDFWVLTIISIFSFIYCCDLPVVNGFEFFINDKQSIYYGVGMSIIASYIFYIIQVVIPRKLDERAAYDILEKKIETYLNEVYWVLVFCESLCNIEREKNKITIISQYARWIKNGEKSKWIVKFDICFYQKQIKNIASKIVSSGYYMQIERNKRKTLQRLFDNNFVDDFKEHIEDNGIVNRIALIQKYDEFKSAVNNARKQFKIKDELELIAYIDRKGIVKFENESKGMSSNGLVYMKIED